jgi:histidyl-tRNA synthetase
VVRTHGCGQQLSFRKRKFLESKKTIIVFDEKIIGKFRVARVRFSPSAFKKMKTDLVKGFKDFQGKEAEKRAEIKNIIENMFKVYGFEPAETPIIEYEEFVKGDNEKDEAVSDIFKLKDRGERELALRYEFTFQLKRLMKNQKLPYKRYQIGPVFRDEPVAGNRLRQFIQCDVDVVGSTEKDEAEVLAVVERILNSLNLEAEIFVNNRKLLNEILEKENIDKKYFSEVIREIDKLDKLSESEVKKNLEKYNAVSLLQIFKEKESYFKNFESYKEIKDLKKYCKFYGVKVKFVPYLARGLSYYNGSVFEIKAKGIKETLIAGGSFMFNNVQCTGVSFGVDRLAIVSNNEIDKNKVLVLSLNQDEQAVKIAELLRNSGVNCGIFYGKPSKALEYGDSKNFKYVLFVGEKEVSSGKFTLKDLESGKEKKIEIEKIMKILT